VHDERRKYGDSQRQVHQERDRQNGRRVLLKLLEVEVPVLVRDFLETVLLPIDRVHTVGHNRQMRDIPVVLVVQTGHHDPDPEYERDEHRCDGPERRGQRVVN